MLLTLAIIIIAGFSCSEITARLKLPRIVGTLVAGILIGPFVLNLIAPEVLAIYTDLHQVALVVILLRTGLSIGLNDLKKVGRPAILLSFVI